MSLRSLFSFATLRWILLGLLTIEVCARVEDAVRFGAPLTGIYNNDSIYTYGKNGKQGKPNASYLKWKLNEAGYRGPDLRQGTYRIVCLGASETFGMYESEGHEWPRQLEQKLNHQTSWGRFEVINAAFPGMMLTNNLRQIDDIAALQPRMVLIYPSYTGYLEPERPVVTAGPSARLELRIGSRVETLMKKSLPDVLQDRIRAMRTKVGARNLRVQPKLPDSAITRFESDLTRLAGQLRARGVQVVLITHATRFGTAVQPEDYRYLVAWRQFYPMLAEEGFLDMEQRMRQSLMKIAAKEAFPIIDAAIAIQAGSENFADFSHFTDHGAEALAGLVARDLHAILAPVDSDSPDGIDALRRRAALSPSGAL